jgi:O-antigen/teichoic acid export membrane protein
LIALPERQSPAHRIVWTTGAAVVGLGGGLASGIVTARLLMPGDRGTLAIIVTTVTLAALVAGLGTNVSLRLYLPRDSRVSLWLFGRLSLLLSVLQIAAVVVAILILLPTADVSLSVLDLIIVVGPLSFFAFVVSQLLDALNAVGKTHSSALANAAGTWTTAAVLVIGLFADAGLTFVLTAYTIGFLARIVVAWDVLGADLRLKPEEPHAGGVRLLMSQGAKLMGLNLGQSVAFRVDQYALAGFASPQALGQYAVAVSPASMIQVLSNSIGQVAMRDAATDRLSRGRLLRYVAVAVGGSGIFAGVMAIVAPWLVPFVFGSEYAPAARIVQILALAEVALAPYLVLSKVAAGWERVWLSSTSGLVGLGAMLVIMPIFVIAYGAEGAAWGCVCAYSLMSSYATVGLLIAWGRARRLSPPEVLEG